MLPTPPASPYTRLHGELSVPGDKSISHRSVMLSTLCRGSSTVTGLLPSADVLATLACLQACGLEATCTNQALGHWTFTSPGWPLAEAPDVLDCGNSGTSIRLLAGYMAALGHYAVLTGDASLRSRPMARVIEPLNGMGANLSGRANHRLAPITLQPVPYGSLAPLNGWRLPMASAQVKSALILAALQASGPSTLIEPLLCRDHTERMLAQLGHPLSINPLPHGGRQLTIQPLLMRALPQGQAWQVPGDPSSAAFWAVAATLTPDAELTLNNVSLNPTRTGLFTTLQALGAKLSLHPNSNTHPDTEPIGTIHVSAAGLAGSLTLAAEAIPAMVDELPILMVAALFNQGTLTVTGAEELRAKESDRLAVMAGHLERLGASLTLYHDGFSLTGHPDWAPAPGADLTSPFATHHDHRIAMALAVLNGVVNARQGRGFTHTWRLDAPECVAVSYPTFFEHWQQLGGQLALA
jgi:3-phosphoshikimate 1-carboxyvinyltransferase